MRKALFLFQKFSKTANMAVSDGTIYEFADFRLIPRDNLLLRDGEPVSLPPKAFSTLVLLLENHGHLVRKEELIENIWADAIVEESAVSRCIWTIRSALGEDSKNQQFIQTVPKRGYKFVADVAELKEFRPVKAELNGSGNGNVVSERESLAGGLEQTHEPAAMELSPKRRRLGLYFAFAAVALAAVGIASVYISSVGPTVDLTGNRIAILPLKPIDAANRSDIYEFGVSDALINRLNSVQGFTVRPLSAMRKYDALDQDPLAAGREQMVEHVLESNYQIVDGKFRLTTQLINVWSGQVEQSFKVESDAGSVLAIQDAVADEIASKLIARFGLGKVGHLVKRGTNNEEAYRLYLHGRNLTMRRQSGVLKRAIEYFEQAIKLDPNFALAYARMAHALWASRTPDKPEAVEKAMALVKKALELDPNLAEAHVTRGYISLAYHWDFGAAESDFRRALELEPNNDTAHWLFGVLLADRELFNEGLREIEAAIAIDPSAVLYMSHRGRVLYYARRYDEAKTQFQQAMDLDDSFVQPYFGMVRIYETKGDYETAFRFFLKQEERSPRKDRLERYQKAYETSGWVGVRREVLDTEAGHFDLARLHSLRGEKDAAFENLNKAFEQRDWQMTTLKVEPAFDNLRGDPRYAELLSRVYRQ